MRRTSRGAPLPTDDTSPGSAPAAFAAMLVDESTAARALGNVSPKSLYNWRKDGSLLYVKLGTRTMYRPEDLADFIARRQVKGPPP